MTIEGIIRMAKQAGFADEEIDYCQQIFVHFAMLVAEHEREQCKKLCQWKTGNQFVDEAVAVCYRAIDQRGQA